MDTKPALMLYKVQINSPVIGNCTKKLMLFHYTHEMPLFYKFINRSDGTLVPLNKIDELVCKDFGIPCHEQNYSIEFQIITSVGDAVWSSGNWNQKIFDNLVGKNEKIRDIVMKYINGEYIYECWVKRRTASQ